MKKIIAAINMSLDGFCDHDMLLPDEEVHDHYTELLNGAGLILYGRTTYQLMQYWQPLLENPSDEKSMNDFAKAIDKIPKMVFSGQLKNTGWDSASLAEKPLEATVSELKQQSGKDILVGSRSLILSLMNHHLIDELQICIHPLLTGKGSPLFDQINNRTILNLFKTKTFKSGAITLYYKPV